MKFLKLNIFLCIVLLIAIVFYACTEKSKNTAEREYDKLSDKSFSEHQNNIILNEDVERGNKLKLPAVSNWDDIIRIRGKSGWGMFDYICSIYNDQNKRIQLIKQNNMSQFGEEIKYTYYERILSEMEYDTIIRLIEDNKIYEIPFDLEPNSFLIDGPEYTFARKKQDFTKVVFWQDERVREYKSDYKDKMLKVSKEILYRSNYPFPKAYIRNEEKSIDSISYLVRLNDYALPLKYDVEHKGTKVYEGNDIYKFPIAIKDTSQMKEDIKVFITLGNSKREKLKEVIIEQK